MLVSYFTNRQSLLLNLSEAVLAEVPIYHKIYELNSKNMDLIYQKTTIETQVKIKYELCFISCFPLALDRW